MIDLDKLIQQDALGNISDELLAAYIDGNTTEAENVFIEQNSPAEELNTLSELLDDTHSFEDQISQWDGDYGFWELGIPPVINNEDINNLNIYNMPNELNQGFRTFGESAENLSDPIFIQQPDDHSCALRSQQIILRDFGIDIPFDELEKLALEAGVYSNEGTRTYDIGKVLEMAGVGMHQVEGSSIYDLTNELAQGHRVIVSVDADELWYNDSLAGKFGNWLSDTLGHQGGNHALIVAGIEVDVDNPNNVKVVLTDPGAGHLRVEYPMEQFMDAWQDSNCFIAATDNAAPYQYNAQLGMEVPSNFVVDHHINDFIANHSWQLNGDQIMELPSSYQPAFTGHIDKIGSISYDTFEQKYDKLVAARHSRHSYNGQSPVDIVQSLYDDLNNLFNFNHLNGETAGGVGQGYSSHGLSEQNLHEGNNDDHHDDHHHHHDDHHYDEGYHSSHGEDATHFDGSEYETSYDDVENQQY